MVIMIIPHGANAGIIIITIFICVYYVHYYFQFIYVRSPCSDHAGQCWSDTDCNAIGIAWSKDGLDWSDAQHLQVGNIMHMWRDLVCTGPYH